MTFSGTSFDAQIRTGLRALGTSLLMLGIGELFNHPNLHKQLTAGTDPEMGEPITLPWRKPCGLGNLLLVLSIIMFFISLSYLFFQKG
ncbi:MAG: hypothetical protein D6B25_11145 [Desulfobulbaceae bacterium]|nr:MAG: hypothetical protein D6B25_11145 [Desulfobulbaceae bacterium]